MSTKGSSKDKHEAIEHVVVDKLGGIQLPSKIRERYGITSGDELAIWADDDGMRLLTADQSLRAIQNYFCSLAPPDVVMSTELLKDRREEVRREDDQFRASKVSPPTGHTATKPPTGD